MNLWSKIKNKLGINRKYVRTEIWVDGIKMDLDDFEFKRNRDYLYHAGIKKFQLLKQVKVTYYWKKNGTQRATTIHCKIGYLWNGASIPKMFQPVIGSPFEAQFALASCIHDKATEMNLDHYPESRIFYEILKTRSGQHNVPKWKEDSMYVAVYSWSLYTA